MQAVHNNQIPVVAEPRSKKSVFTIATGSEVYLRYAFNLARSFALHNDVEQTSFYIVTDLRFAPPADLSFVRSIDLPGEIASKGLSTKLHLDVLAPTEISLFLDADCLVFRNLEFIFERFRGHPVSVVGVAVADGDWCGPSAADLCAQFGFASMPRFNGGLYYLEKGAVATSVYQTARQLQSRYDALGFHRHRGWINEEPLVSLAMAVHSQVSIADDGCILSDLAAGLGHTDINVLDGKSVLYNPPPPSTRHKWWQKTRGPYSPAVIHFTDGFPYNRESFKLALKSTTPLPDEAIGLLAFLRYSAPYWSKNAIKSVLRPTYKRLFGHRSAQPGDRPSSEKIL
jgi:hypothetical protein